MSFLLDIATHMETLGLGYTTGYEKDIFVFQMPETVSKGILLRDAALGTMIDHELPGYYHTEFQCIVRSKEHAEGEAKANAVSSGLTILNQTIGTLNVKYVRPRHIPMVFPVSDGDYLEWLIIFDICFVKN